MAAARQRNTDDKKCEIKAGRVPKAWKKKPAKLRQKGRDARRTLKFSEAKLGPDGKVQRDIAVPTFGYQNHISIDRRYRLIRCWQVTDVAYEGRMLCRGLLDRSNTASGVWADAAYRSKVNEQFMARRAFVSHVHRKKPHVKPMPKATERANSRRSAERAHAEHVFAEQKDRMGLFICTIGLARATTKIGLDNLACNTKRLIWLQRMEIAWPLSTAKSGPPSGAAVLSIPRSQIYRYSPHPDPKITLVEASSL